MNSINMVFGAMAFYALGALGQWMILRTDRYSIQWVVNILVVTGLLAHSYALYHLLYDAGGIVLTAWTAALLITWSILMFTLAAACYEAVHNLYMLLLPLVIVVLWVTYVWPGAQDVFIPTGALLAHVLLSFVAYSLATITAAQAVLLGYQDYRLRRGRMRLMAHIFPPLQTMERLLFALLAASWLLLSASLCSGFYIVGDSLAPYFLHRTLFSVFAWCLFTWVLWGRWRLGWRGKTAVQCILSGFFLLVLAYCGSRLLL